MDDKKNYGFVPSEMTPDNYMLGDGCLPTDVIFPTGNGWKDFLPTEEFQSRLGLETFNCTGYGTYHAAGTLGKKKFGPPFQSNLSERYLGVLAGTIQGGNDPHFVCEVFRKYGAIPEAYLPFSADIKTIKQYYSPLPMTVALLQVGAHWLTKYSFRHEWVFLAGAALATKQIAMKEALKYSPLGASGYAWAQRPNGLYYSAGPQNHWFEVYGFSDGQYWEIFDTYDSTHKKLEWDYDFGQVKRFHLELNAGAEEASVVPVPSNWMVDIFSRLFSFFHDIIPH